MMRPGAAFVAVCMVLIAGSLAAILYLWTGLSGTEAVIVAIAVLTTMVVYNAASTRIHDQEVVGQQIADLSRGTADLARQVGEIGRRIEAAEVAVATAVEKTRAATGPLASEIETLGNLVKQLAESVAAHEAVLTQTSVAGAGAALPAHAAPAHAAPVHAPAVHAPAAHRPASATGLAGNPAALAPAAPAAPAEAVPERLASGRFRGLDRAHVMAMIAGATEANRVDLYLQPIVSLPQRKVRFYEAVARLRMDDGDVLA